MTPTTIIAGIGAGLASVLLLAAVTVGTAIALPLLLISPLPVAIAGFAWGRISAALAAITIVIVAAIASDVVTGIGAFLLIALPVALLVYLASLWRPKGETDREWYPLDAILVRLAAAVAGGLLLTAAVAGYDSAGFVAALTDTLTQAAQAGGVSAAPDQIASFVDLIVRVAPPSLGAILLAMAVGTGWLGSRIAEVSGVPRRPRPPLWTVRSPRLATLVFVVALALSFVPGTLGEAASAIAGAFGAALALTGLGVVHSFMLGRPGRTPILTLVYLSIPLFGVPALVLAALGFIDSLSPLRPPLGPPSTPKR